MVHHDDKPAAAISSLVASAAVATGALRARRTEEIWKKQTGMQIYNIYLDLEE